MSLSSEKPIIPLFAFEESALIWNCDDVKCLRQNHRIVGSLIGCLPRAPRQIQFSGLPLLLMKEEVDLILRENIGQLFSWPDLEHVPNEEDAKRYRDYEEESYQGQVKVYREDRKKQILSMIDKIMEGKLKKKKQMKKRRLKNEGEGEEVSDEVIDKDKVVEEMFENIKDHPRQQMIIQTFLEHPEIFVTTDSKRKNLRVENWNFPKSERERLRTETFRDLWQRGFFVTGGEKFGGDFLAYPGDPISFHAKFIVICFEDKDSRKFEEMNQRELVAKSRLGTNVNKTILFSFFDNNELKYKSPKWTGKV